MMTLRHNITILITFCLMAMGTVGFAESAARSSKGGTFKSAGHHPHVTLIKAEGVDPFSTNAVISFFLDRSGTVSISIQTPMGETVRTLLVRELTAGKHSVTWDGLDNRGQRVKSGVYVYNIQTATSKTIDTLALLD